MNPRITLAQLRKLGACTDQVKLFEQLFGDSVKVTEETCRAVADRFDWDWIAGHLLTYPARKVYAETIAPAWKAYIKATAPAWKVYAEPTAPEWMAYIKATTPVWKVYAKTRAAAFARAYIAQETEE